MKLASDSWLVWALLSALFAALTAIFGKVGVARIDSDFATLIRSIVIVGVIALIVLARGAAQPLASVPRQTWLFLTLSALATGAQARPGFATIAPFNSARPRKSPRSTS
jgi:transporter family protein